MKFLINVDVLNIIKEFMPEKTENCDLFKSACLNTLVTKTSSIFWDKPVD